MKEKSKVRNVKFTSLSAFTKCFYKQLGKTSHWKAYNKKKKNTSQEFFPFCLRERAEAKPVESMT